MPLCFPWGAFGNSVLYPAETSNRIRDFLRFARVGCRSGPAARVQKKFFRYLRIEYFKMQFQLRAIFLVIATIFLFPAFCLAEGDASESDSNWPSWRGPGKNGVAATAAPTKFSATENVKWKVELPGRGFGTPIIWGDKIFITASLAVPVESADDPDAKPKRAFMLGAAAPEVRHQLIVLCLDRTTGATIWKKTAREFLPHEGFHYDGAPFSDRSLSSYANQSPVTDGERLYVSFGSRGAYCYDLDGNLQWERDFIDPSTGEPVRMKIYNRFGESSSPALHGDTLVFLFDHEGQSFIEAVNKQNGETIWKVDREADTTWGSPLAFEHEGQAQVCVVATDFITTYDLATGEVLWKCKGTSPHPASTPVVGNGLLYAVRGTQNREIRVIRLGGSGDLTGTDAVVWQLSKAASYDPSALLWGDEFYVVRDGGMARGSSQLSNFDAATGDPHYLQERLPSAYTVKASPIGAGEHVYLASEEGDVIVLQRGPEYKVVAINEMDEMFLASPVVVAGELYLRGKKHLFCISD